jgi:hypothetical protein
MTDEKNRALRDAEYDLARARFRDLSEAGFEEVMQERFPECSRHYEDMRRENKTTWSLGRAAQAALFEIVADNPLILDYVMANILSPEPYQGVTLWELEPLEKTHVGLTVLSKWRRRPLDQRTEVYRR